MDKEKNKKFIETITEELKKCKDKTFKVLFYVLDTKGMPNGSLTYIYETAYQLSVLGYNVQMLHSENDFVGVGEWLGEKYANLPHFNIENKNVSISPSDILFIPEIYSSVMYQTKDLPCKRIAILQNFGYLTEMIQPGATWDSYGVYECITTSENNANRIKEYFPTLKTHVVRPSIAPFFEKPTLPKKLIVNIVSKNKTDVNSIVKPFFWKYPLLKWVCFRDINGLPKSEFADALKEAAFTVWVDDKTDFGYSPLEAMACGDIVIGKIPEVTPEWMTNEDGTLKDNGLWCYGTRELSDIIANAIDAYIHDSIPTEISDEADKTIQYYFMNEQIKDIIDVYEGIFADRANELEEALIIAKNNDNKND